MIETETGEALKNIAEVAGQMAEHAHLSAQDCEDMRATASRIAGAVLELGETVSGIGGVTRALSEAVLSLAKSFEGQRSRWQMHEERWGKLSDNCVYVLKHDPDGPLPPMVPR